MGKCWWWSAGLIANVLNFCSLLTSFVFWSLISTIENCGFTVWITKSSEPFGIPSFWFLYCSSSWRISVGIRIVRLVVDDLKLDRLILSVGDCQNLQGDIDKLYKRYKDISLPLNRGKFGIMSFASERTFGYSYRIHEIILLLKWVRTGFPVSFSTQDLPMLIHTKWIYLYLFNGSK